MDGIRAADYLSKAEIQQFTSKSNGKAAALVISIWLGIAVLLAIPALWPNPVTIIGAIILLGGRQMALGVLTHDCGHRTLCVSKRLNQWVGRYLAGNWVLVDFDSYAKGHLAHHRFAGTEQDPDLANYRNYPVSRASFRRKIIRDISGQTGLKLLGYIAKNGDLYGDRNRAKLIQPLLTHAVFISALLLISHGWLYLLWLAAFLSSNQLFLRLRQVAEHASVSDLFHSDPRLHTRTTYSTPFSRLFLAVNAVNYHMEHHLMPSVPCYNLRAFHQLMKERGAYQETPRAIAGGYREVFRLATAKT